MSKRFGDVSSDAFVAVEKQIEAAGLSRQGASGMGATAVGLAGTLIYSGIDGVKQVLVPKDRGGLDARWDLAQQRFTTATLLKQTDPDAKVAEAARIVGAALLWEDGALGQTKLSYEAEVDFGLKQIEIAERPEIKAALKAAGLVTVFEEVREATLAFEEALNRAPGEKKALSPVAAQRAATRECARRFTLAYGIIEELKAVTPSGPESDALGALLQPLDALADRA
jgi:hypothetical protein